MKKLVTLFLIFFSIHAFATDSIPGENKFPFNYGKMKDTIYSNPYFGFSILIPSGWNVQNKSQIEQILAKGKDILEFDDEQYNNVVKKIDVNSMTLLMLSKYETGAPVPYNPTLAVMAESVLTTPGIKRGSDYLYHVKYGLDQSNLGLDCKPTADTMIISTNVFDNLDCDRSVSSSHLGYLTCIVKKYAFSFIFTYAQEEEKNELMSILRTAVFKK